MEKQKINTFYEKNKAKLETAVEILEQFFVDIGPRFDKTMRHHRMRNVSHSAFSQGAESPRRCGLRFFSDTFRTGLRRRKKDIGRDSLLMTAKPLTEDGDTNHIGAGENHQWFDMATYDFDDRLNHQQFLKLQFSPLLL